MQMLRGYVVVGIFRARGGRSSVASGVTSTGADRRMGGADESEHRCGHRSRLVVVYFVQKRLRLLQLRAEALAP